MKTIFIKIFIILLPLLSISLFADKIVTETATINYHSYPDKDIDQLKELVLKKAKLQAAYRIYGELLLSYTSLEDGAINSEHINNIAGGIVHIVGEPIFKNGVNLGDIQVTIQARASDEDIKRYQEQTSKNDIFKKGDLQHHKTKKGFYGLWSGYIMYNNHNSTKVEISISTTGRTNILYSSFACGGDLLTKQKSTTNVEFKKILNFGQDECIDKTKIVLIKKGENKIQFSEYKDDEKLATGVLYREGI